MLEAEILELTGTSFLSSGFYHTSCCDGPRRTLGRMEMNIFVGGIK